MSIVQIAHLKNANSKRYREIVSEIYAQFRNLYSLMEFYDVNESLIYLDLACKCFEKVVAEDLEGKRQ